MNKLKKRSVISGIFRVGKILFWLSRTAIRIYRFKKLSDPEKQLGMSQIAQDLLHRLSIPLKIIYPPNQSLSSTHQAIIGVSNHISWLDIFVIQAAIPTSFIAKEQIQSWPIIGTLADRSGTLFISRATRKDITLVNQGIVEALQRGQNVSFFPESTTSDGKSHLPFKAALFQSSLDANAAVQPMTIRYLDTQGNYNPEANYVDNDTLIQSVWRIARSKELCVQLIMSPLIFPNELNTADRYSLKNIAESAIENTLNETISTPASGELDK